MPSKRFSIPDGVNPESLVRKLVRERLRKKSFPSLPTAHVEAEEQLEPLWHLIEEYKKDPVTVGPKIIGAVKKLIDNPVVQAAAEQCELEITENLYSASVALHRRKTLAGDEYIRKPEALRKSKRDKKQLKPRRLLYSDPGRFEYYDDGSLRIIDKDILKGIDRWYPAYKQRTAKNPQNGDDQVVDGRSCGG